MKKTIFLILIFFSVFVLANSIYALDCSVSTTCNADDIVLRMFSDANSNAALYSYTNYPYAVCCAGSSGTRTCSTSNKVLRIFGDSNAHVEKNTLTTTGYSDVCFDDLVCGYSSDCSADLGSEFKCLASMSSDTNAHIAKCDSYTNKVCCKVLDLDLSCNTCIDEGNKWDLTGGSCTGAVDFSWETGLSAFCCGDDSNEFYIIENCPGASGKTACCDSANDKINEDGNCVSSCEEPCTLNRAYWSKSSASEGETVNLIVEGNANCIGKTARFTIEEIDLIGNDLPNIQPSNVNFINSGGNAIANGIWIAEWQEDGLLGISGDPEYSFTAFTDNLQIVSSEPKLTVVKSGIIPSCGNGIIDNGENCQSCPDDAGCGNGELCCSADAQIECKTSCTNDLPCNNNGICDDTESCDCADCNNEQDGCGQNTACNIEDESCVTVISQECIDANCNGDGTCNPECSTTLNCPGDVDCSCDEYEGYLGEINYPGCIQEQCNPSDWNAAIECCFGSNCGSQECFDGWTCPEWSKCLNGQRTRGSCTRTTPLPAGCESINTELTAQQTKACVENVKFPVYDNLNLLLSVLILIGYYLFRRGKPL